MFSRLRRFSTLAAEDRRLVIQAFVLQILIAASLRLRPFGSLRRMLARISRPPIARPACAGAPTDRVTWAVVVSSRYLGRASTCLTEGRLAS